MKIVLINLMITSLNLLSPFFVNRIIDFIETKDEGPFPPSYQRGFIFVFLLVVTQAMYYLVSEHLEFYFKMIGIKSANSLIAMIYRK